MKPETEKIVVAAQGFLELGLPEEALAELAEVPESDRSEVEVLEVEVVALLNQQSWTEALEAARQLCDAEPEKASGFIHAAYCLHETGRTREARDTLLGGPESLRSEATFYYNLSCYAARLEELEEARQLLGKAFELDDRLRDTAKKDPDLEAIRDAF